MKKVILFGTISALLLAGCGRSGPTGVATPVPLGSQKAPIAQPVSPSLTESSPSALEEAYPSEGDYQWETDEEVTEDEEATEEVAASTEAELEAAAEAAKKAEEEAKKKADEEAAKKAEEEAKKKAEEEAAAAEEAAKKTANKYVGALGNGSLNSAHGLAFDSGKLYVVDNARTGLLGKFAAVRVYDAATGDYLKVSFENVGWAGAKNMPTTVTKVKFEGGKVLAADDTTTYVFDAAEGALIEKKDGTFDHAGQVTDAKGYTYRLKNGQIDKMAEGKVLVSFGAEVFTAATAIAIGPDGKLYVTDGKVVHKFEAAVK